jgi:hypothetical protein
MKRSVVLGLLLDCGIARSTMRLLITAALTALALSASAAPSKALLSQPAPQNCECTVNVPPAPAVTPPPPDLRGTADRPLIVATHDSEAHRIGSLTLELVIATGVLALATFGLAIFGARQVSLARKQVALGQDQMELARQEFVATNRPRLMLREAYTAPDGCHPMQVTFRVANLGNTGATVLDNSIALRFETIQGTRRQARWGGVKEAGHRDDVIPRRTRIAAGGDYEANYSSDIVKWREPSVTGAGIWIPPLDSEPGMACYFYGTVTYMDDVEVIRNMAFFRKLNWDSWRFIPLDKAEAGASQLEYSDTNP